MRRVLFLGTTLLGGCAPSISPNAYSVAQVGSVNRAVEGTILSIRPVTVDRSTGVGGAAGVGIGAAGGSALGSNTEGAVAGAIAGAVVGGLIGASVERRQARTQGYEYVVRTQTGALLTLVQGEPALQQGQRVIVLYGSPARIIAADSGVVSSGDQ